MDKVLQQLVSKPEAAIEAKPEAVVEAAELEVLAELKHRPVLCRHGHPLFVFSTLLIPHLLNFTCPAHLGRGAGPNCRGGAHVQGGPVRKGERNTWLHTK